MLYFRDAAQWTRVRMGVGGMCALRFSDTRGLEEDDDVDRSTKLV